MQTANKICSNCGSINLISDRSLGGKIICLKCGSTSIKQRGVKKLSNKKMFYFLLFLLIVLIIIVM